MSKRKILYVTQEMDPYAKLSPFAKLARLLPQKMQEKGMEVRAFMPRYGKINERRHRLHEVIRLSGINIPVGETDNPMIIKVASLPSAKMQVYFLDNEDFFHRKSYLKNDKDEYFDDTDERMIFFNKGVMEILMKLGWAPDIIHCQGWLTSLIPHYARTTFKNEPVFKNSKIVMTVTDDCFEHTLGEEFLQKASINGSTTEKVRELLTNPDCKSLYRTAVNSADGITVLSENINEEVEEQIKKRGVPVLRKPKMDEEDMGDDFYQFYEDLLEE